MIFIDPTEQQMEAAQETPPAPKPSTSGAMQLIRNRPVLIFIISLIVVAVITAAIVTPLVLTRYRTDATPTGDNPDTPIPGGLIPGTPPSATNGVLKTAEGLAMDGLTKNQVEITQISDTVTRIVLLGQNSRSYIWMANGLTLTQSAVVPEVCLSASSASDTVFYSLLHSAGYQSAAVSSAGVLAAAQTLQFTNLPDSSLSSFSVWDWGSGNVATVVGIDKKQLVITYDGQVENPIKLAVDSAFQGKRDALCIRSNKSRDIGFVTVLGVAASNRVYYAATEQPNLVVAIQSLTRLNTLAGRLWEIALSDDGTFCLVIQSGVAQLFRMEWSSGTYVDSKFKFVYASMESGAVYSRGLYAQIILGFDGLQYMMFTVNGLTGEIQDATSRTVTLDLKTTLMQNTAGPMATTWIDGTKTALHVVSDTMGHTEVHTLTFTS